MGIETLNNVFLIKWPKSLPLFMTNFEQKVASRWGFLRLRIGWNHRKVIKQEKKILFMIIICQYPSIKSYFSNSKENILNFKVSNIKALGL